MDSKFDSTYSAMFHQRFKLQVLFQLFNPQSLGFLNNSRVYILIVQEQDIEAARGNERAIE